jgi:DNA modification methylase
VFPFLIVPKASKSEKNKGVKNIEKNIGHNRFDKCKTCGGYILQNPDRPSACKCKNPVREHNIIKGNFHPTCKPIKLMSYLIILGSRKGDVVLDMYIGSGTTALSARLNNRHYLGFENNKEYYNISLQRLISIPERLEGIET